MKTFNNSKKMAKWKGIYLTTGPFSVQSLKEHDVSTLIWNLNTPTTFLQSLLSTTPTENIYLVKLPSEKISETLKSRSLYITT